MSQFELYEVFVRPKAGLDHRHVGSVHASDKTMALTKARELYTRRMEGVSPVSYTHLTLPTIYSV